MITTSLRNRSIACLAVLAIVLSLIPALGQPSVQAQASSVTTLADPVTMNDWQYWFGEEVPSTENAGRIWTDKSVMTDASEFGDSGIRLNDKNGFLVALSAIASNTVISGMTNIPTDMMLVLDVSQADASTLQSDVSYVNRLLTEMQKSNMYNRVGVTVYSGGANGSPSTVANSKVLLPLDRYTCADGTTFVKAAASEIAVANGVTNQAGQTVEADYPLSDSSGVYTQLGLLTAMEHMLSFEPAIPDDALYLAGKARLPFVVLISDHMPTAATLDYTKKQSADIRVAQETAYGTAQVAFATQLTAAFVKEKLKAHYHGTAPLMYTLSSDQNGDITDPKQSDAKAQDVMTQPDAYDSNTYEKAMQNRVAAGYWQLLLLDGAVAITAPADSDENGIITRTVSCAAGVSGEEVFPAKMSDRFYVDEVFVRSDENAVEALLAKFDVHSHYHPTLVTEDADLSGYLSFVDKIGEYMKVTDIKGIMIDDTLCSGAVLSKNFITGGGALGTFNDPKPLGDELVWAVQARIGVDADTARDLLGLAYAKGQLAYTDDQHFSNYIGWYANKNGEYLGFWYDGITSMPDPEDPDLAEEKRPAYIMKSYGYLGKVDTRHGVTESDFMYATVQHRTDLLTGEETISFAVPASLIPMVNYEVTLCEDGTPADMRVTGAKSPIRLVYEVSLDTAIDAVSVTQIVDEAYPHRDGNGTYYFYTNQFEADDYTGYGAVNTYSYFVPSRENARYYYTANEKLYTDQNGTLLRERPDVNGVYYRAAKVFVNDGTVKNDTVYEKVSSTSLGYAKQNTDGTWYIPEGTVCTMLDSYIANKIENATDTLSYRYMPFVDAQYTYYVGATLGNNGRVAVAPETGILLSNTVLDDAEEVFSFDIVRTDTADSKTYHARLVKADGSTGNTTVTFKNSQTTVRLANGESLLIYGMNDGASYRITQNVSRDYRVNDVNGDVAAEEAVVVLDKAQFARAAFTVVRKGVGNLTVTNRVSHEFDSTYEMPERVFTLCADLGTAYAGKTVCVAHSADPALTSLTADENGKVTFSLRHTEQLELMELLEGTEVTVTETDVPAGFTPVFYGVGEQGRDTVTVKKDASISMIVLNRYETDPIEADIGVAGSVTLVGRDGDEWTDGDVFTVELQRYNGHSWETVDECIVDKQHTAFDFGDAMRTQYFEKTGVYSYQIIQKVGDTAGIVYDRNIHTFSVTVGDPDMNGLHITQVACHRNSDIVSGDADSGFTVSVAFENHVSSNEATVSVDIITQLQNDSESDIAVKEGIRYGLFENGASVPMELSPFTDQLGETRMIVRFDKTGVYTYELRQMVPDISEFGIRYDNTVYTVVVTVSEKDGHLTAQAEIKKDDTVINGEPVFYIRYEVHPASLALAGTKELVGRPLSDGEFTFIVKNGDDIMGIGQNRADGIIEFENPLVFAKVGDYYYDVVEKETALPGVSADTSVYRLHIRVFDGGDGDLYTHHHVINSASDDIVFRSVYTADPVELTLDGKVILSGRELVNEEFHFILIESEGEDPLMLTAANRTDGSFSFDPIVFTKAGQYEYIVQEVQSSATHGITSDNTIYTVNVTVVDDGDGMLDATYTLHHEDTSCVSMVFENAYVPTPHTTVLGGVKTLEGRKLREGEYTFVLVRTDNTWSELSVEQTTQNRADGSFAFEPITVTEGGVYRYLIKEQNSGETVDGVAYDAQYYRVLLVAKDNHRGKLEVTRIMIDSTNTFCVDMAFTNRYAVREPVSASVTGTVRMNGRQLKAGEFSFALYAVDEQDLPVGEALSVVTNRADGSFAFESVMLDTVGTHRFAVVQQTASLADVVYDKTVHLVSVVTEDNGVGGLKIVSQAIDGNAEQTLVFENTYTKTSESTTATLTTATAALPKAPQTGETQPLLRMLMLAVCGMAVAVTMYIRRKAV